LFLIVRRGAGGSAGWISRVGLDVAIVLGLIAWTLGIMGRRTLHGKAAIVILCVSLIAAFEIGFLGM